MAMDLRPTMAGVRNVVALRRSPGSGGPSHLDCRPCRRVRVQPVQKAPPVGVEGRIVFRPVDLELGDDPGDPLARERARHDQRAARVKRAESLGELQDQVVGPQPRLDHALG
ncbi:MAG: hypothetical protein ACU0CO_05655, partial [Shimia sp.]